MQRSSYSTPGPEDHAFSQRSHEATRFGQLEHSDREPRTAHTIAIMEYALVTRGKQVYLQALKLVLNHSRVCRHYLPTERGFDWQTSVEYIERRATERATSAFMVAPKLYCSIWLTERSMSLIALMCVTRTKSGTAAATYKNLNATAISGCRHCGSNTPTAFVHSRITTHPTPARACTRTQPQPVRRSSPHALAASSAF